MKARTFAPAKVNLTLHVTGQRPDGYHLLESLVMFADVGDVLSAELGTDRDTSSLRVDGPMAEGVPTDSRNLILRAAQAMDVSATFALDKHLPAAAGIGGGSSDAAAAMRLLSDLSGARIPSDRGLSLGADVPVCLLARAATMCGIGERVTAVDGLPPLPAVLVNPRVSVSTPDVFRTLKSKSNPKMDTVPEGGSLQDLVAWLETQRNDLEPAALHVQPVIDQVLKALDGALLARMSGSGATCFGIYPDLDAAKNAAARISKAHPAWWVAPTTLR